MPKYTGPAPSFQDVFAALPALPKPLLLQVALRPVPGSIVMMSCSIELVYVAPNSATYVWRRWGGNARLGSPREQAARLMLAAHECAEYTRGLDPRELAKRIAWDLGLPEQRG